MKKIFLFAALASIVFASCQKEAPMASVQNEGQQEVTFAAFSKAMTKGVLGSGGFATDRTIQVAGTMKSGDKYVDFLEAKTFRKIGTATTWQGAKMDATNWVADPVYYPIGGQNSDFRFLAYSETTPGGTDKTEATFARWYGSNEVELQVSDCAKNEIVYSGFEGNKTSTGGASATFARTQALVTVQIKAKEGSTTGQPKTDIIINKIGFKDVKTSGTLLLKYDAVTTAANKATAQWLYNAGCNCAFAEMGDYNLGATHDNPSSEPAWSIKADETTPVEIKFNAANSLGSALTTSGYVLDRLFPAQKVEAATMIINYTLGDLTTDVELDLSKANLSSGTNNGNVKWEAGKRYVYIITVNVSEILIAPQEIGAWEVTTVTGQYDADPAA